MLHTSSRPFFMPTLAKDYQTFCSTWQRRWPLLARHDFWISWANVHHSFCKKVTAETLDDASALVEGFLKKRQGMLSALWQGIGQEEAFCRQWGAALKEHDTRFQSLLSHLLEGEGARLAHMQGMRKALARYQQTPWSSLGG